MTVEFLHGHEMAYFDARSKGLVQTSNSKHFPINQYLHDRMTSDDKYPWLDSDDIGRNMTDKEILQMKLNLKDSVLDEKGKEEFLAKVEQFTDVFSLRDEIGTCPFIEVHLKLKDEMSFFVRPYPMREEQKSYKKKWTDLSI